MKQPSLRPSRSVNALTLEDAILTTLLYGLFALYSMKLVAFSVLFIATYIYIIRAFTVRHEKSHKGIKNYSGILGILTHYYTIFHTPYQEPFLEKQRKHLAHHHTHLKSAENKSYIEDPHKILEEGPWYKALLVNLFYEEIMFYLDFKHYKGISRVRVKMLLVSSLCLIFIGFAAGWENILALVFCYRIGMSTVWFLFSYFLHSEPIYSHSDKVFHRVLPHWMMKGTELLLGSSNATVVFFHRYHHENPNRFYKF